MEFYVDLQHTKTPQKNSSTLIHSQNLQVLSVEHRASLLRQIPAGAPQAVGLLNREGSWRLRTGGGVRAASSLPLAFPTPHPEHAHTHTRARVYTIMYRSHGYTTSYTHTHNLPWEQSACNTSQNAICTRFTSVSLDTPYPPIPKQPCTTHTSPNLPAVLQAWPHLL